MYPNHPTNKFEMHKKKKTTRNATQASTSLTVIKLIRCPANEIQKEKNSTQFQEKASNFTQLTNHNSLTTRMQHERSTRSDMWNQTVPWRILLPHFHGEWGEG
jgi:hypothetical protein